ncbi:LON peptidase substrate-binding domain-containing protein [Austwickia chelonae]|uniref:LON peptidase substrate-binding domain-containing protein n=1 Tax=Austwickia chelonae TaxID=100225 RepID=UPI000E260AA0|nr:LON peptidase substrate-binding domain-containing protein [Austwickia chelonae]
MPALSLFPLGAVVVPGERLSVRVTERRHLMLLRDLLRSRARGDGSEFGVIAVRWGQEQGEELPLSLHQVGCSARILEVKESGNAYQLRALGVQRFRLDGFDEGTRTPYLKGYVTWLTDRVRDPELVSVLAQRLREAISDYRDDLGLEEVELPMESAELSHLAMRHVMLEQHDRQRLLESRDVDARLLLALQLTRRESTLQRELGAFPGAYRPATPVAN